jgi:hypothetical protein
MQFSISTRRTDNAALWFGLLGGAMAWSGHFLMLAFIAEWGYFAGLQDNRMLGVTAVVWVIAVATAIAVLMAVAALVVAWRMQWRQRHRAEPNDSAHSNWQFMSKTGVTTNMVFLFIIVAEAIPALFFLHG